MSDKQSSIICDHNNKIQERDQITEGFQELKMDRFRNY